MDDSTAIIAVILLGVFLVFFFLTRSQDSRRAHSASKSSISDASVLHPELKRTIIQEIKDEKFDVDSDQILLRKHENLLINLPLVSYCEERAVRRSGRSAGVSFRVARGLWIRTGGFDSESTHEVTELDCGDLAITSDRLIFVGSSKTLEYPLSKIIRVDADDDQVAICRAGKQRIEYFVGVNTLTTVASPNLSDRGSFENKLTFLIDSSDIKEIIYEAVAK